jgi:hypothetical protein
MGVTCSGCCELSSSAFFRASAFFRVFWLLLIDAVNLSQVRQFLLRLNDLFRGWLEFC